MKKFKGFTPDQQFKLLSKLGYKGPNNSSMMAEFLQSTPAAGSKLQDYARMAQEKLNGLDPGPKMAAGGLIPDETETRGKLPLGVLFGTTTPDNTDNTDNTDGTDTGDGTDETTDTVEPTAGQTAVTTAIETPTDLITPATASQITPEDNQFVDPSVGQVSGTVGGTASTVDQVATATAPDKIDAAQVTPVLAGDQVDTALQDVEAATAQPSAAATVQGQLESLMADFEGGATPPWASGAMRQAMAIMQQRGLGASSMAGSAVVQAAMESAFAIASQDAQTQAQFEMANLSNEQQTTIFKAQQRISTILSDQAQQNAAEQFNASSQNQVNQFFAGLEESVSRFNAEMVNSIAQFNAGEENSMEQFNANIQNLRDQFNAQNSLIIAQANAKWRQDLSTFNTAAQNEANLTNAKNATGLTMAALDELWQYERDLLTFAYNSSESQKDRDVQILLANKKLDAEESAGQGALLGTVAGAIINNIGSWF